MKNERLDFWARSTAKNGDDDCAEKIDMAKEILRLRRITVALYEDSFLEPDDYAYATLLYRDAVQDRKKKG